MTEGTACTYEKKFSRHNREPKAPYILCGRQAATFTGHGARTTTGIDIKVGHHLYEPGPHTYFARQGTPSRITNHEPRPTNHDPRITTTTNDKNRRPGQFLPPIYTFAAKRRTFPTTPRFPITPTSPIQKLLHLQLPFQCIICSARISIYTPPAGRTFTNHEPRITTMPDDTNRKNR